MSSPIAPTPQRPPARRRPRPAKDVDEGGVSVAEPTEPAEAEVEAEVANAPDDLDEAAVGSDDEAAEQAQPVPESFEPMRVVDVVMALPNPNPVLVLEEVDAPHRRLVIPIGLAEATQIAYALRQLSTPKPLTHELFTSVLGALDASVEAVRITAAANGAFFAEIVVSSPSGQQEFSCRPSDAVGLALRQRVATPIVVASELLDQAGTAARG